MSKLKHSEWDPLSNGVFRVTTPKNTTYLAVSRSRGVDWFSQALLQLAKEKDGYLFFPEPEISSIAIFASEELAKSAHPECSPGDIRSLRSGSRRLIDEKYGNPSQYLEPPAPDELIFPDN